MVPKINSTMENKNVIIILPICLLLTILMFSVYSNVNAQNNKDNLLALNFDNNIFSVLNESGPKLKYAEGIKSLGLYSVNSTSTLHKKQNIGNSDKEYTYTKYEEAENPNIVDREIWKDIPSKLQGSYGSIDIRYPRNIPPNIEKSNQWNGIGWKGERVSAQIVIWANEEMGDISFSIDALKNAKGSMIDPSQIRARFIRYVLTDEFAGGCGSRKKEDFAVSLVADAIDELKTFKMNEKTTRPIWVSIDIPQDAEEGTYKGKIEVISEKGDHLDFYIALNVQNHRLPLPKDWTYHLDLWQNPYSVARYHNVELWSKAHFHYLKPLLEMLANAGQKCITTSIINKPWNGQTEDPFESMIKWIKKADGSWQYDYTIFDKWVSFAHKCGITEQINCYSMVPWRMSFVYFDQAKDKMDTITAAPGNKEYTAFWTPFLQDFTNHLKTKNWISKTTIAMDERPMKVMQEVIKLIKNVSPELKISLAGGYHEEIADDIYDLCVALRYKIPEEVLKDRETKGKPTTYYTCCAEHYPNNFSFSPPAEGVWQAWHAAAEKYDGYLRWAYNSWVKEPLLDSRFRTWPAGDTYFVYPEARTSIRFERLREGIQDYEKIRILKQKLREVDNVTLLNQLNMELKSFKIENLTGENAAEIVNHGKKLINQISEQI